MNGDQSGSRQGRVKSPLMWAAYALILVVPLYALSVIVLFRSGLLAGGPLNDEQYKAMWTFLASGLATAATVLAALMTKSHNDRAQAQQAESDARKAALEREALARQRLETVVSGLGLLSSNGTYAPRAVIAGALSTLVELGHPPVASRALSAALDDNVLDNSTTTWLLDAMLRSGDATLSEEAAALLESIAGNLTRKAPGTFDWPMSCIAAWPAGLSSNAGLNMISALVGLLVGKDREWWGDGWSWIGYTLHEAMLHDASSVTKGNAAVVFIAMAPFLPQTVQGFNDMRDTQDVLTQARALESEAGSAATLRDSITTWGEGRPVASRPTRPADHASA